MDEFDVKARFENERLDRIDNHMKLIKASLSDITTCLVGSGMNGNKGLVHEIDSIKNRLLKIEERLNHNDIEESKKDVYIGQLKFIVILLTTVVFGGLIKIWFKI